MALNQAQKDVINNILKERKLKLSDLNNEKDLVLFFEDFYAKTKDFSIFEQSQNQIFKAAINKVKDQNDKNKTKNYWLNIESTLKQKDTSWNLSTRHLLYGIEEEAPEIPIQVPKVFRCNVDTDTKTLATQWGKARKDVMDFRCDLDRKWKQKKDVEVKKFDQKQSPEVEEDAKNLYLLSTVRDYSLPQDSFVKFLDLLRKKKQSEYEKDPYVIDCGINIDSVYHSSHQWDLFDRKENYYEQILQSYSTTKKLYVKNLGVKEGEEIDFVNNEENLEKTEAWYNFENDIKNFLGG